MFSNLTYEDKHAFFQLLDEYFESRPHLGLGGGQNAMMGRAAGAAINSGIAGAAINSGLKSRGLPAIAPDRPSSSTSSPDTGSPHKENAGAKAIGSASKYVSSGMNKVTSNSHVSKGLGKVGAGGLASKFTPQSSKPYAGASVGYERTIPPAPGGLSSGRNHPPPPTRRAASDLPQAQAMYDYAGGDSTDLPVQENQLLTIVAKTSDDWWTCEDATGKQGLVPANYLKEL